jgi:transposase
MDDISYAGIEVSCEKLLVCMKGIKSIHSQNEYSNTKRGHTALAKFLARENRKVRVVMEATGVYSVDLAIYLSEYPDIEVMVLNPLRSHHFAQVVLNRSKNDKVDAIMLLQFAQRMEFKPFVASTDTMYALRAIARKIASINRQCTMQKNQLHASSNTATSPKCVIHSTKVLIKIMKREIEKLTKEAMKLIEPDPDLHHKYDLLNTIPGVAKISAIQLIAEIGFYGGYIPPKSLVAMAGLDPCVFQSGKSVERHKGISRRGNENLRRALYMPGMVAKQDKSNVAAFSNHLLAKGKKPKQVTCAVMRKLLHSITGMFKNDEVWDGNKFFVMT